MKAQARGAEASEYELIGDLILRSFKADERNLWDYLVANDPVLRPEGVRVSAVDGKIVACTVVVPREIRTRAGWTAGAVITLVCCDPDYRRQGHGGATVLSALDYCRERGLGVALLYGIPDYYPRFGFVPVLPSLWTDLEVGRIPCGDREEARLEAPAAADIPAIADAYDRALTTYPLSVRRRAKEWVWRFRTGPVDHEDGDPAVGSGDTGSAGAVGHRRLLVLRDGQGCLSAYARFETEPRYPGIAIVPEASVDSPVDCLDLIKALLAEAGGRGLDWLRLTLPPDQSLVRAALLLGARQLYRPATSGMAAITDWQAVLPGGYAIQPEDTEESLVLTYKGRSVLSAQRKLLVQMALGYRGAADLLLLPGVRPAGGAWDAQRLRDDFPALYPRWTEAPYWFPQEER
jgi:predicted N-acetyltransferase YhbS